MVHCLYLQHGEQTIRLPLAIRHGRQSRQLTMVAILPSDLALLASFTFYRLVHRYADGPHPSLSRLSAVIKG